MEHRICPSPGPSGLATQGLPALTPPIAQLARLPSDTAPACTEAVILLDDTIASASAMASVLLGAGSYQLGPAELPLPVAAREACLEEISARTSDVRPAGGGANGTDSAQVPAVQPQGVEETEAHLSATTLTGIKFKISTAAVAAAAAAADRSPASFSIARSSTSMALLNRMSVARSAASAAISRVSTKLQEVALGDDHSVHDKWDNYDDDDEDKTKPGKGVDKSVAKSVASGTRAASRLGGAARVCPEGSGASEDPSSSNGAAAETETEETCMHAQQKPQGPKRQASSSSDSETSSSTGEPGTEDEYADADAADKGLPVKPGFGLVYEHATVKLLLWYYVQTMLYSGIVAAVCIPLVTLFSSFHWHVDVEVPEDQDGIISPIQPNNKVFQWMLLFWIANPLTLYCPLLLACIKRSIRLPWQMYAVCAFTLCWGTVVCGMFYAFDIPYWYWYIDLFVIVAAYVPCMCIVGWFIEDSADATWKDRLWDVAFTATLETIVAASTLLYCWFLMPLFYALEASWQKLVWLCVIHPLYYEVTTGFIVRKALYRNSTLGRSNIVYFLSIVHSMAHQVSISTMLQASVEPTRILAVTVCVYNASKLFWRSTVIHRHLLGDRMLKGWSYNFSPDERTQLARMVSVHVLTEVVLENASIMVTPFLMYRMYEEPLFMMVVPNTFHKTGGAYPADTMAMMIFVMLSITVLFDVLFWLLNYHVTQFLPLINTWRRIKRAHLWYLCFLVYAFSFMGVLFVFLVMMLLPRGTYCKSNNYCDCVTYAYQSICKGDFFTLHHDYLVDIESHSYT